jgi:anaerobic ribonucleoside-triphosphate reductase activating protein
MIIRVGAMLSESYANGPGCRSVLWVQGCSRHCPGCWNPALLSHLYGIEMTVQEVFNKLTISNNIEGVTLLGGEPFEQVAALVELSKKIKDNNLTLMAYSGWTIEELKEKGGSFRQLLELCDILIDGQYIRALAAPLPWRGSTNQDVHFITSKYRYLRPTINNYNRDFEIMIMGNHLVITGDPPPQIIGSLENKLGLKSKNHENTNDRSNNGR